MYIAFLDIKKSVASSDFIATSLLYFYLKPILVIVHIQFLIHVAILKLEYPKAQNVSTQWIEKPPALDVHVRIWLQIELQANKH